MHSNLSSAGQFTLFSTSINGSGKYASKKQMRRKCSRKPWEMSREPSVQILPDDKHRVQQAVNYNMPAYASVNMRLSNKCTLPCFYIITDSSYHSNFRAASQQFGESVEDV